MSAIAKLIAKQVSLWEVKRRLEPPDARRGRKKIGECYYGPYLLISRERGSGGDRVAHLVGEQLGWQVFDRKIVDAVAEHAQVRQQLVRSVDERARTVWEDTFRAALAPEDIGSDNYVVYLKQVVSVLGLQGDVVLVGRGAHYILPWECGVRVRIVAPVEWRAARVAAELGVSPEAARREVQKTETERLGFIRRFFKKQQNDPLNHDLVANTAELGVETTAELVLMALRKKLGVRPRA